MPYYGAAFQRSQLSSLPAFRLVEGSPARTGVVESNEFCKWRIFSTHFLSQQHNLLQAASPFTADQLTINHSRRLTAAGRLFVHSRSLCLCLEQLACSRLTVMRPEEIVTRLSKRPLQERALVLSFITTWEANRRVSICAPPHHDTRLLHNATTSKVQQETATLPARQLSALRSAPGDFGSPESVQLALYCWKVP